MIDVIYKITLRDKTNLNYLGYGMWEKREYGSSNDLNASECSDTLLWCCTWENVILSSSCARDNSSSLKKQNFGNIQRQGRIYEGAKVHMSSSYRVVIYIILFFFIKYKKYLLYVKYIQVRAPYDNKCDLASVVLMDFWQLEDLTNFKNFIVVVKLEYYNNMNKNNTKWMRE